MSLSINNNIYNNIIKYRKKTTKHGVCIQYCKSKNTHVGFILPSSIGSACKRNLFKRRCRSVALNINKKVSVLIKPKSLDVTYNNIVDAFNNIKLN